MHPSETNLNTFLYRQIKHMKIFSKIISMREDEGIEDSELRFMCYRLGCYVYRSYLGLGDSAEKMNPSKFAETKLWSIDDSLPMTKEYMAKV